MSTELTKTIISNAKQAVDTYMTEVNSIAADLNSIITKLTGSNFQGDAADGYTVFYTQKIVPGVTENLTGASSLMKGIKDILETIQTQLMDTVDTQLGDYNKNPGSEG